MSVIELTDDSAFVDKLSEAGQKLVVVDFYATWCGPCNMVAPFVKQLATRFANVVFLKVDVDKCPGTAAANNVQAMPTFIFFRNRVELERMRGADKNTLENKVKQFSTESADGSSTSAKAEPAIPGLEGDFIDLLSLINKGQSECLNQDDDHPWDHALNASTLTYLKSDVDEQILLNVAFNQPVKLHSLIIQGPADNGPKNVRIFINQTRSLDFDSALSIPAIQEIELKPEDLKDNTLLKLRYVKFQNVQNITVFFVNNHASSETTVVQHLKFIGTPVAGVSNMSEFKRVSGQAGEAHG